MEESHHDKNIHVPGGKRRIRPRIVSTEKIVHSSAQNIDQYAERGRSRTRRADHKPRRSSADDRYGRHTRQSVDVRQRVSMNRGSSSSSPARSCDHTPQNDEQDTELNRSFDENDRPLVDRSMGWSPQFEKSATETATLAKERAELHEKTAEQYELWHKILENAISIMQFITAIIPIGAIFAGTLHGATYMLIATALTAAISGIIARFHSQTNYQLAAVANKSYAAKHHDLHSDVELQMNLPASQRQNARDYVSWIKKTYNNLADTAPHISYFVYRSYLNSKPKYVVSNDDSPRAVPAQNDEAPPDTIVDIAAIEQKNNMYELFRSLSGSSGRDRPFDNARSKYEIDRLYG